MRFPTVAELFQGTATATSITVNDPKLEPEVSDSVDFTVERAHRGGRLRASLFQDDVRDSIFAQTNITVTPNVTNVQNVDRVRTRGIETAFSLVGSWHRAPEPGGQRRVCALEDPARTTTIRSPSATIGRACRSGAAICRPSGGRRNRLTTSLGVRYSGAMYNRLENDDINPDTYGGVSRFTIVDARIAYMTLSGIELALGIDNLTDEHAYQSHPYPGRTGFLEARWSFEGAR